MRIKPNAQYNVADPSSLAVRIAASARRRMYQHFIDRTALLPDESVLDVGVTADQSYDSSNYLENWYPYKDKITAVGLDDASFLMQKHPGVIFVRGDGRELPFGDQSFDVVHSSAVLEHVGGSKQQKRFIQELVRVSRRAVFFTTPNRWFPVEFHSLLPFVHWLPRSFFRRLLRNTRYDFFSYESNLHLLGRSDIENLCEDLNISSLVVESLRLIGCTSNLMVTIRK